MDESDDRYELELHSIEPHGLIDGANEWTFHTNDGSNRARYHAAPPGSDAVVFVFGAGGGLGGPAGGLFERMAQFLYPGAASLQLDYRRPGRLLDCTLDVLVGIAYLELLRHPRVVLVGHSFGGAVVINAGILSDRVVGVAALSSQAAGTERIADLSPRPLLLLHGENDEVLPVSVSHQLYARAAEPKQIRTYPGCGHGLDQCRDQIDADLFGWLTELLIRAEEEPELAN